MQSDDFVFAGIPATYLLTLGTLLPLGIDATDAMGLGSVVATAIVGQALFINPPQ
ncbi:hypothetical protein ACFQH6_02040 [Halobacteriaceae archaeon GCM10025711]